MLRAVPALFLSALAGCAALAGEEPGRETRAVLERVRAALGLGGAPANATILVRGHVAGEGDDATFEHVFGPKGAFRSTRGVRRPLRVGYDGDSAWKQEGQRPPRPLALGAAAEVCFRAWLEGGAWAGGEIDAFRVRQREGGRVLELRARDDHFAASVWLDGATSLPRLIECDGPRGVERTRFSDWRVVGERRVAFEIVRVFADGREAAFRVDAARVLDGAELALLEPEPTGPGDTSFHADRTAGVPARRLPTGHMVVQARLEGRPPAWFLLDTGAGRNLIHTELASTLGWPAIGDALVTGTGGEVSARLLQGDVLDVGPATIRALPWVELDLDFLETMLGVRLAGVLGYDVFARAVVDIDWTLGSVTLFDPALYPPPGADWHELAFDDTAPCIRARFAPGKEAWFRLDTGSDDTVAFHTSTVLSHGLGARIDGARTVRMEGVGGGASGRRGRLEWFELGDLRFHRPRVTLVDGGWGTLDDPYLAGNLGTGFLVGARVILHYPAQRVSITAVPIQPVELAGVGTGARIR